MLFSSKAAVLAVVCILLAPVCAQQAPSNPNQSHERGDRSGEIKNDVQLRAMQDELARAKTLQLNDLDKPYYIRFAVGDADEEIIAASLGGLTTSRRVHQRHPQIEMRVGSNALDNTDSVFWKRVNIGLLPIDDDYTALRTNLWLGADGLYKTAVEQITRKRNALREIAEPDATADFAPAPPVELLQPPVNLQLGPEDWEGLARRLSARFASHANVLVSDVRFLAFSSTYRVVNSEGTVVRVPQEITKLEIRASAFAKDGSAVWNSQFFTVFRPSQLASEARLADAVDAVASQTENLEAAPVADEYSGPVLFEQEAAAQLMAQLMADTARLHRKPVAPRGSNEGAQLESVWSSRVGSAVTPPWMSIVDDPLQSSFQGALLTGHYQVDDEGVMAQRVVLVDKGVLKGFLMSRTPVRNSTGSNGHGRLPGAFGEEEAVIGNLFVNIDQPTPEAQMKQKLIEEVRAAGLKYGILIRRLDFPSTAGLEELQGIGRQLEKSGYARTVTPPLIAYRVYPDGREELVRSVRFKELSAKDLRDLSAASDKPYLLNYMNNGTAFDFADIGSEQTTSSVICPSLLFDSVDLDRAEDEPRKPAVVPAPTLTAQK